MDNGDDTLHLVRRLNGLALRGESRVTPRGRTVGPLPCNKSGVGRTGDGVPEGVGVVREEDFVNAGPKGVGQRFGSWARCQ